MDGAAAWLKDQGSQGVDIKTNAANVGMEYSAKDPAKALEWHLTLPESSRSEIVLERLQANANNR